MKKATTINESIWTQFGASLDMLENAIKMCPDEHWNTHLDFWYTTYHCIFWTDYFLTTEPLSFAPPQGYTLSEYEPDKKPDIVYSKATLMLYLTHCRNKAKTLIAGLTTEQLSARWINEYKDYTMLEVLLYNMRHVQHHVAQLNLLLRQSINDAPIWVSLAKDVC